jgi:tetratricopeptide (TPR) repeat protein
MFQQALSLGRADEASSEMAQALLSAGRAAGISGRAEQSRQYFEASLRIYRQLADPWGVAYALNELGLRARRQGRLEHAQAMLEESHVLVRLSGSRMGERSAVMNLARITLERGALARAATLALDSLELCQDMADHSATTARCVEIAAEVLLAADFASIAVSLLAAAESWREQLGAPVPRDEQPELDNTSAEARRVLSGVDYAQAAEAGRTLVASPTR